MVKVTDVLQELCNKIYRWLPQPQPSAQALKNCLIIAHRGCWNLSDRLENTMPAFQESLHHDIWAIEFDIRWTQDNVPVIHHDESTLRVFQKNLTIADISFAKLRQEIPQIPTLQEVVDVFANKRHLMMELKTLCTDQQVKILQNILSRLRPVEDFHFMSLETERFKNLDFVSKQSFVTIARTNIRKIFRETMDQKYGALTGQYILLTNAMRTTCQAQGIKVGTGFPDSQNLFYREASRHVDWVFTNHAIALAKLKNP